DDHHPNRLVAAACFGAIDETFDHLPRNGIEAFGPVERHRGDTALALEAQSFDTPHVRLLTGCSHPTLLIAPAPRACGPGLSRIHAQAAGSWRRACRQPRSGHTRPSPRCVVSWWR